MHNIRKISFYILAIFLFAGCSINTAKELIILETTDIHGAVMPYDYIGKEEMNASLASVYSYVKKLHSEDNPLILLDNGDNLQGQPGVYYYNFVDTVSPHILAQSFNLMAYDAVTVGNHDVETGHRVYDRIREEYKFPMLAANAIDEATGEPYFRPYHIIRRNGLKVAVLGLVTQTINNTLPAELYSGIEFTDLKSSAVKWMKIIAKEKPDLIVGLFHTGWNMPDNEADQNDYREEDGAYSIAYNIPGFDIIFTGHDHKPLNDRIVNVEGDTVLILNAGSHSGYIARADIIVGKKGKKISGSLVKTEDMRPDNEFVEKFADEHISVLNYVNEVIADSEETITSRDSYFGSSAFVDLIHKVQLSLTDAEVSFAAPLSFDVSIPEGPVTVGDMFKLYRFENMLYTVSMSGEEIKNYLEFSYSGWFNTMNDPADPLLKLRTDKQGRVMLTDGRAWLRNQAYNFDSATGIEYTVDVTKPEGSRISISGMSDGREFRNENNYIVTVNSYRANGGGGHFQRGAGISKDELLKRRINSTDRDLRYHMIEHLRNVKNIRPEPANNWRLIPENIVSEAKKRDYKLLFGAGFPSERD